MRISTLIFFLVFIFLFSCTQREEKPDNGSVIPLRERSAVNLSIMQLDERLSGADSLVFIFYNDPHGKDSLRYTRFYRQYATIDSALIQFVKANLLDSTTRFEKIKKCHSEGKIWCFKKGEIFQTIYFSSFSEDCSFLYIIRDGQFYYSGIPGEMTRKLGEIQKKAFEPGSVK